MTRADRRMNMKWARAVVAVVSTALVAALLGGTGPVAAQETAGLIPHGDWTEEQVAEMLDLIDATEATLPADYPVSGTYEQIDSALGAMGFHEFGAVAPGGYYHWVNTDWWTDEHVVDPAYPESLVYQGSGGSLQLVSAMFMLDPSIDMASIPADIAWLPGWHGHPELCVTSSYTMAGFSTGDPPQCLGDSVPATTPMMMHVWIVDNGVCDHRFGGVGVGGVHCDHGGHGGHPDEPGDGPDQGDHTDDPDHGDHTDDPDHGDHTDDPDHGDHTDDPDHDDDHGDDGQSHTSDDSTSTAQPASPVVAEPTYAG